MLKQEESDKTDSYFDQRSEAECDPYGHSRGARQTERPENQDFSPFLDTKRSGNSEGDKGDQCGERRDAKSSYRIGKTRIAAACAASFRSAWRTLMPNANMPRRTEMATH